MENINQSFMGQSFIGQSFMGGWFARRFARQVLLWVLSCVIVLCVVVPSQWAAAETVARCGQGWLERIDGYLVLHVKGTPSEMGFQHGALLKDHCRENLSTLMEKSPQQVQLGPITIKPHPVIRQLAVQQRKFIPPKYYEEMDALADGAGLNRDDVYFANFIPELFHCSGFAVMDSATKDGTLYHGRVLDYAVDWQLQNHAVLVVAEPDGGIPFVNISYAGFIGSVSGMNLKSISIGEMGGGGLGHWQGMPMALLVREVLETTSDLDAAIRVFQDNPRTCHYYFVIADGKTNRAVALDATWREVHVVRPGEHYYKLPSPVPDALLLSAGDRYQELVRRVKASHGQIDSQSALRLMDRPVSMGSNLHNVLFESRSTRFWVANASLDGKPAAEQKYHPFRLNLLVERQPDPTAIRIPERNEISKATIPTGSTVNESG